MIVEDEPAIREVYMIKFEIEGHRVCGAENGQVALGLVDSFRPDVILLDLMMPIMGGLEFMRKLNVAKHTPEVIVFSNMPAPDQIKQAKELGAAQYWVKSDYTPELATKKVMEHWRKRQSA